MTSELRRIGYVATLLSVLVLFSGAKALHLFHSEHHHHSEHVCGETDGDINDGKDHLHDAHFLTDDCQLCDYVLGTYDLPGWEMPVMAQSLPDWTNVSVQYKTPALFGALVPFFLRGPPAFLS